MEGIWLPGLLGFLWGLAVSLFNNFWTIRALMNPSGKKGVFFFSLRLLICGLAMFLVYKNLPMLIGTALGLLAVKNYILIKTVKDMIFHNRKG